MSEKEIETQEVEKKQIESEKNALQGKSADELIEIIRETRTEAKERRLKAKELEERLSAIEKEKEQQITEKKLAEGKKDEVILELQQKLSGKDKEYEPFIEKAKKYDEYDTAKRTTIKETLKDKWLTSFDSLPLADLEKLASQLSSDVKLPGSDNGNGKKNFDKEYFTLDELKRLTNKELADPKILEKANKSMEFHGKK